tara:strand:- start:11813 stop:12019 length:207 start_codon:yes stop_codon:yes gene_type:complete
MKEFNLKKYLAENKLVKEENFDEELEKIDGIVKAVKDLGDILSKDGKVALASKLEPIAKTLKYRGGYY